MKKKRFNLTFEKVVAYGPTTNNWAFVNKVKGGYEVVSNPMGCKDYIQEGLANKVHNSNICVCSDVNKDTKVNMEKFQIAMFFTPHSPNFKRNLYSIKKYINSLEKKHGLDQTSILEVNVEKFDKVRGFIITSPKEYIESPALHHGLVAMLRTLHRADKKVTPKNVAEVIEQAGRGDVRILRFAIKHDVLGLLMKNHKKIMKGLTLKDIYPKATKGNTKATSYHSGYGLVAVCSRKIFSKAYSNKLVPLLEEAGIPMYGDD